MDTLRPLIQKITDREGSPGIIGSHSVKAPHHMDSDRGNDGNKRARRRKEHIAAGTHGIPMAVAVREVSRHDNKGAPKVVGKLGHKLPRLRKILADDGYQGYLGDWVFRKFGRVAEVVLRPDGCPGRFHVLPRRWIVERTFS